MNFSESSKDSITTVCYGEVREWDERAEARNHFLEAMMNSDGAERERYSVMTHFLRVCGLIGNRFPRGFTHTTCATAMIVPVILVSLKVMSW